VVLKDLSFGKKGKKVKGGDWISWGKDPKESSALLDEAWRKGSSTEKDQKQSRMRRKQCFVTWGGGFGGSELQGRGGFTSAHPGGSWSEKIKSGDQKRDNLHCFKKGVRRPGRTKQQEDKSPSVKEINKKTNTPKKRSEKKKVSLMRDSPNKIS